MTTAVDTSAIDQLLDPFEESLTPDRAQWLASLRASPAAQARLDALSALNSSGKLTAEEEAEYTTLVHAGAVISLLQAKAKRVLRADSRHSSR
jgi:hypothetical protein